MNPTESEARATTAEELRGEIVAAIDDALRRPIISRFISAHAARVMRAQRSYWQNAPPEELERLLELFNKEP